jgi:hypothetical protein
MDRNGNPLSFGNEGVCRVRSRCGPSKVVLTEELSITARLKSILLLARNSLSNTLWITSSGKRHRYYSHRTQCPEGGLDRIDAEMMQEFVLGWLRDVASNGERIRELEAQGKERKGTEGRWALLARSIAELESLVSKEKSLFSEYRGLIQEVLPPDARGRDKSCAMRPEPESAPFEYVGLCSPLDPFSRSAYSRAP